jgi:hypothetical protein
MSFDHSLLDWHPSQRLRQLLRNACDLNRIVVKELMLAGIFPDNAPRSTVARVLSATTATRIDSRFVTPCATWLANLLRCSTAEVAEYVHTGSGSSNSAILELSAKRVFAHTAPSLLEFTSELKPIEAGLTEGWVVSDIPSASLLSDRVMQRVYRWITCTLAEPFHRFRIELDFGRRQQKRFDRHIEGGRRILGIILTYTGLDKLLGLTGESVLAAEERDIFIETILDRIEVHGLRVGLLDDRPGRPGAALRPFLNRFDFNAVCDGRVSIRRARQGLARLLYVASESPAQAAIVRADVDIVGCARRLATLDPNAVTSWLLEHASDDSWRKIRMRMNAHF